MTAGHYVIAWLERPHRDLANASAWFAKGRAKNYAPWRIWAEHDQNDGGAVNFITGKMMIIKHAFFHLFAVRLANPKVPLFQRATARPTCPGSKRRRAVTTVRTATICHHAAVV